MEKREIFEKNIKKKGNIFLIVGLFIIVSALITDVVYYFSKKDYTKDAIPLINAKTGDFAYVEVELMSPYFAIDDYAGTTHKTYFVFDDKYAYIADIKEKDMEKLNAIYDYVVNYTENKEKPEKVTIYGKVKTIPSNLKKIAIDGYNDFLGEKKITSTNFKDYLGTTYLDTYETPISEVINSLSVSVVFIVIGTFFVAAFICVKRRTKKNIKRVEDKWDNILNEIDSSDCLYFKKANLYLTKNYLISYLNGLEIFDYKDIVWIYPHEYRYNGSLNQKSIFIVTKDSKAHKLATVSASKKNLIMFDEMYESFLNRIPDVLSGYTKENKIKAKEMYEK